MFGMIGQNPKIKSRSSSTGATPILLPGVGPFQLMTRPDANSLPDFNYTVNTTLSGAGTIDTNPVTGNNITLQPAVHLTSSTYCLFIWANVLTLKTSAMLNADGQNGQDINTGGCNEAGNGGDGASGGGGGSIQLTPGLCCCTGNEPGGVGGDGNNGTNGTSDTFVSPGNGGLGYGRTAITRYPVNTVGTFDYGIGGAGSGPSPTSGWGGGGDGGGTFCDTIPDIQGGGGGGGGIIIAACRILNGIPLFGAGVRSQGGFGGNASCTSNAGSGGNGNIHLFAQKYTANTIGAFAFSTIKMYEVASDGVTILNVYTNDTGTSWDHT